MKFTLLAAAAVLAAPAAFAQSATVHSSTTVTAPAGVVVSSTYSPVSQRPLPAGAVAQAQVIAPVAVVSSSGSSTAVMGASAAPVTRYWFNVPRDIDERAEFLRWQRLL
ncbi:MAG: hypothetical protein EOO30_03340 [Comamonadaceae bacterium]|nr:MAG: hypothetical protein EOO30_03340 [Comamonadaceae bacterium]